MLWVGVFILISCGVIRLIKQCIQRYTLLWALLSIVYTVGFHVGTALVLVGTLWG
jgi:hypothetical protein